MDLQTYKQKRNAKAAVVFFTAPWCKPCKSLYPLFEDMRNKAPKEIKMFKVDVTESPEISDYCQVESMPTFRFYFEGAHLHENQFSGANKEKLVKGYNRLIDLLSSEEEKN